MSKATGSRPRPAMPKSRTKSPTKPSGNRRATREMPMPHPNRDHGSRGGGRAHGG